MPYIGNQPGTGVRSRFIYTATASQTTFSGADDNSKTLKYADSDYIDVYLNGVCLVQGTDYTASTKTSVVLTQAASLNDTLEVVAYDIATISDTVSKADGGRFDGLVTFVQAVGQTETNTTATGSLTLDYSANQNFVLTLTGDVTLANPSTEAVGQSGFIVFIQDSTGGRSVSLDTDYETAAGAGINLSSTASATDIVPYIVAASGRILLGAPQLNFS